MVFFAFVSRSHILHIYIKQVQLSFLNLEDIENIFRYLFRKKFSIIHYIYMYPFIIFFYITISRNKFVFER